MGNSLGGKKTTKVMKINGETFKLKTPVKAEAVVKDYPGHVLLESEAVKHYGVRAKPLQPQQNLQPKRLYFLVELPNAPQEKVPRRVRSGINMSAKDRLESLMLSRRSVSDLSIMKPVSVLPEERSGAGGGGMRLKMKLPKSEVEKLVRESKNEAEIAEKIMGLCMANTQTNPRENEFSKKGNNGSSLKPTHMHWKNGNGKFADGFKPREKRVSFMPISEGGSQIAVAS